MRTHYELSLGTSRVSRFYGFLLSLGNTLRQMQLGKELFRMGYQRISYEVTMYISYIQLHILITYLQSSSTLRTVLP